MPISEELRQKLREKYKDAGDTLADGEIIPATTPVEVPEDWRVQKKQPGDQ